MWGSCSLFYKGIPYGQWRSELLFVPRVAGHTRIMVKNFQTYYHKECVPIYVLLVKVKVRELARAVVLAQ
jgi:hypothetical protein